MTPEHTSRLRATLAAVLASLAVISIAFVDAQLASPSNNNSAPTIVWLPPVPAPAPLPLPAPDMDVQTAPFPPAPAAAMQWTLAENYGQQGPEVKIAFTSDHDTNTFDMFFTFTGEGCQNESASSMAGFPCIQTNVWSGGNQIGGSINWTPWKYDNMTMSSWMYYWHNGEIFTIGEVQLWFANDGGYAEPQLEYTPASEAATCLSTAPTFHYAPSGVEVNASGNGRTGFTAGFGLNGPTVYVQTDKAWATAGSFRGGAPAILGAADSNCQVV